MTAPCEHVQAATRSAERAEQHARRAERHLARCTAAEPDEDEDLVARCERTREDAQDADMILGDAEAALDGVRAAARLAGAVATDPRFFPLFVRAHDAVERALTVERTLALEADEAEIARLRERLTATERERDEARAEVARLRALVEGAS